MKYHNKKVEAWGMKFDSKLESRRYFHLWAMQQRGEIRDLKRQVHFTLLPTQRGASPGLYTRGPQAGLPKPGPVLEKGTEYVADFTYYDADGNYIVEDTKGVRTKDYILKRKLMLYFHGIRIKEVSR